VGRNLSDAAKSPRVADEKAADEVWYLWDAGVITDDMAALAWLIVALDRVAD
jgi:hypothetical protein